MYVSSIDLTALAHAPFFPKVRSRPRNTDVGFENAPISVFGRWLLGMGKKLSELRCGYKATVDKAKDPIFRSARRSLAAATIPTDRPRLAAFLSRQDG